MTLYKSNAQPDSGSVPSLTTAAFECLITGDQPFYLTSKQQQAHCIRVLKSIAFPDWSLSLFHSHPVPALVHPLKVYPLGIPPRPTVDSTQPIGPAASANLQVNSANPATLRVIGSGSRENPIDLTGKHLGSAREVFIQCQSTCASVPHHLQWQCANSVSLLVWI